MKCCLYYDYIVAYSMHQKRPMSGFVFFESIPQRFCYLFTQSIGRKHLYRICKLYRPVKYRGFACVNMYFYHIIGQFLDTKIGTEAVHNIIHHILLALKCDVYRITAPQIRMFLDIFRKSDAGFKSFQHSQRCQGSNANNLSDISIYPA